MLMSTVDKRAALHHLIDEANEAFIEAAFLIFTAAQTEKPYGYEVDGTPIYASKLGAELDKEITAAENGNYITAQELDEISKG